MEVIIQHDMLVSDIPEVRKDDQKHDISRTRCRSFAIDDPLNVRLDRSYKNYNGLRKPAGL
jgi:hypothetical protein